MTSNSFYDTFKTSLEAMKENSVLPLLTTDKDYQNYTNQESMAEAQYMQLDLSAKQKEIVEQLLDARDRQDIEYSNLSYLAGIIDFIKFLKYFNIPIDGVLEDE